VLVRIDERVDLERILGRTWDDLDVVEHVLAVGILIGIALRERV
jgi:hypothetical protein